jgi:nicotinate-nucleotide adenylyltransferase
MHNEKVNFLRTGLFGGTFDPVHNGHIAIVNSYLQSGLLDELWVMPTPNPPFKQNKLAADFKQRLRMTEIAFEEMPNVIVSDFESKLDGISYTLHTLQAISGKFPKKKWFLCIGEDNLTTFHKWYKYESILEYADLLVAERPGSGNNENMDRFKGKIHKIPHLPVDISSTEIRKVLAAEGYSAQVPSNVMVYIQANKLYRE